MRASEQPAGSAGAGPRWLLIGNSRWHWAAPGPVGAPGLRVWHTSAPGGPRAGSLAGLGGLQGWAAVGAVPVDFPVAGTARLELAEVPLAGMPPWLGIDRALVGWAAWRRLAGPVLVADAGTVLSLTRVAGGGHFVGGRLLAGVALQLRAMAGGTQHLPGPVPGPTPVVEGAAGETPSSLALWPQDTALAMRVGVLRGLAAAIGAAAAEARQEEGSCRLLLTGGDGPALATLLGAECCPDLALEALAALRPLALSPGPGR